MYERFRLIVGYVESWLAMICFHQLMYVRVHDWRLSQEHHFFLSQKLQKHRNRLRYATDCNLISSLKLHPSQSLRFPMNVLTSDLIGNVEAHLGVIKPEQSRY